MANAAQNYIYIYIVLLYATVGQRDWIWCMFDRLTRLCLSSLAIDEEPHLAISDCSGHIGPNANLGDHSVNHIQSLSKGFTAHNVDTAP